ncbi:hypothetical protein U9M48_012612 [Paspalum notatum var. saurae]|uniref:DUF295 domain-containing protein n=1 Tax=Paspalum notatum var. saurae TaxID=547442 RepID=A0AAQ3WIK7_PASNO
MSPRQRSPPWSDLPPELLALVLLRLPSHADRAFFTAVCRAWRSAARRCRLPPPSPMPWLMLPGGDVVSFPQGKTLRLPDGLRYHNSCGEWLLLSRGDKSCFLMNPFTKATMPLPALCSYTTYTEPVEAFHDPFAPVMEMTWKYCMDISRIYVQSLAVCSTRLIAAVISMKGLDTSTIALCQPGAAAWSVGTNKHSRWLSDLVFFRGKLYALGGIQDRGLFAIDIVDEHGNNKPRVSRIERILDGVPRKSECYYLVGCHSRLLMICRKINYTIETVYDTWKGKCFLLVAGSSKFEVFEADFERSLWAEVRSLGHDQALFVGRGCSRAVHVSPYDLSRDCIFYVDDYIASNWKKTTTSCGAYDMKDGKVYSPFPMIRVSNLGRINLIFNPENPFESTKNGLQVTKEHLQEYLETNKEDPRTLLCGGAAGSSAASTTSR